MRRAPNYRCNDKARQREEDRHPKIAAMSQRPCLRCGRPGIEHDQRRGYPAQSVNEPQPLVGGSAGAGDFAATVAALGRSRVAPLTPLVGRGLTVGATAASRRYAARPPGPQRRPARGGRTGRRRCCVFPADRRASAGSRRAAPRRATDCRAPRRATGAPPAPRRAGAPRAGSDTPDRRPGSCRPRSLAVTTAPSAMITAPLMRFSSSRTLPGQRCAWMARIASGASPRVGLPKRSAICCSRNCASSRLSPCRSRSGGTRTVTSLMR